MDDPRTVLLSVVANVERVILGKTREVRQAVIALVADGHLLIEDVPGTGKTMLARGVGGVDGLHVQSDSVHSRSVAVGRDGRVGLQPEDAGL